MYLGAVAVIVVSSSSCATVRRIGIFRYEELDPAIRAAVAQVKPALVRIRVVQVDYSDGREVKYEATGSGVIITKEGHVITNHHVAGKAKEIVCTLANKEDVEADRVGTDPLTDICVLKLRSDGTKRFPFAPFGDSSRMKVGDRVLAMGSPLALSQSVTSGIVSNTELVMPSMSFPSDFKVEGEQVGSIVLWVGHDAVIYPGNSGGPLVNLAGEIVGINEVRMGLGGAIPSNLARGVANELIQRGKVKRSWIGVEVQPILKSHARETGVLVSGTLKGSPAEKAGFRPGDILVSLAGQEITVRYAEELPRFTQFVAAIPVGQEVEAVILRDGQQKRLTLVTEERQRAREDTREIKAWGAAVRDISFVDAKELKRETTNGVIVDSVRPGGPCDEAKPAIRDDDVIVEVNGKPVNNVTDLLKLTDEITNGQSEPVPVTVSFERKSQKYVTVVKVGIKELQQSGLEVNKSWLPVATQVLTEDLAKALGIPERTGVRVTQVYRGTIADEAGLQVGDLIVELDGEPIPASHPEDYEILPKMIRDRAIGSEATLTVLRNKEERKIGMKLPASPRLDREMKKYRDDRFEFTVRDVAFLDRASERWAPEVSGVLVQEVDEGGWAALGHLSVGDLIQQVDGRAVSDVDSMKQIMEEIAKSKPKHVVLKVLRGIHTRYIELEPDWEGDSREKPKN